MIARPLVLVASVVLVLAAGTGAALAKGGGSLHAALSGKVEVPKGDPDGAGTAEVKITGTRVCWELKTSRIGAPAAAHIHRGRAGVAGPVVVPLGKTYKAKGCTSAPAAVAAAIKRTPGAYYVNVHNARYPAGALRGQLRSDG